MLRAVLFSTLLYACLTIGQPGPVGLNELHLIVLRCNCGGCAEVCLCELAVLARNGAALYGECVWVCLPCPLETSLQVFLLWLRGDVHLLDAPLPVSFGTSLDLCSLVAEMPEFLSMLPMHSSTG